MNASNMNCDVCRDNLVACVEGLLEGEQARQCQAHLESCAACRAEYQAISRLQERLTARGRVAAEVSLVEPVMRAVRQQQKQPERTTVMSLLFKNRWGLGLGAAATAVAAIVIITLATPKAQAKAIEVLSRGAHAVANLTSIHLKGQLRTLPADNFSYIDANSEFYPIELWKQLEPDLKWRVEKPGRVAVMDGRETLLYINASKRAMKFPMATPAAFDTGWLHRIANLSGTISNELRLAQSKGWKLDLQEVTIEGRPKSIVTVHAKTGVPEDDYVRNKFFHDADTRRVYTFDSETERLEAVQIYLVRSGGSEAQIFDLNRIDYNQPIDPSVWQLDLPSDVAWTQEPQKLPDNEKYAAMTAEEAARAFFEACGRRDWDEVGKFMSPVTQRLEDYLGGVEVLSLGQAFTSQAYPGQFVPYEIRMGTQEINLRLSNSNSAGRYVITGVYDGKLKLKQELKWSKEPAVLPNNQAYAILSPVEVARAFCTASATLDWAEMGKFVPESVVEQGKRQMEAAEKAGVDVRKVMPVMEAGNAFWSAEHSAYFVKCQMPAPVKKHNLALRKDNKAGRWQVDGGI